MRTFCCVRWKYTTIRRRYDSILFFSSVVVVVVWCRYYYRTLQSALHWIGKIAFPWKLWGWMYLMLTEVIQFHPCSMCACVCVCGCKRVVVRGSKNAADTLNSIYFSLSFDSKFSERHRGMLWCKVLTLWKPAHLNRFFSHAFTISQVLITCWPQQCRVALEVHSALPRIRVVPFHVLQYRKIVGSFFSLCRTSSGSTYSSISTGPCWACAIVSAHWLLGSCLEAAGDIAGFELFLVRDYVLHGQRVARIAYLIKECKLQHLIQDLVTLHHKQNCCLWHLVGH